MKRWWSLILLSLACAASGADTGSGIKKTMSDNKTSAPAAVPATVERLTVGGGCFWCLEAVFQRLEGVTKVVSGYAGGAVSKPTYEQVCNGDSGHAEVIQITFDPARTQYGTLLEVFWAAHDPTSVLEKAAFVHGRMMPKGTPYQGNDYGTQYRSAIFYETDAQKAAAMKSKEAAQADFKRPIATEIAPLKEFFPAEGYHQNYYNLNKDRNPYCSAVITPKLQKLILKGVIADKPVK